MTDRNQRNYRDKGSTGLRNDHKNQVYLQELPKDYLKDGYFDEKGYLKSELLTDTASQVAKSFGHKMTNSQLRRFYQHLKKETQIYTDFRDKTSTNFHDETKLINKVKVLDPFVAEAKGKGKVPETFYQFINKNINKIKTSKDIIEGFLPHFEAVVAYFIYHYPKNN